MIKSFKSTGIVGVPDCDIELGDEKIVIIKGPNGCGKTSLLRQITHPLSSHNRFNKLKPGYDSGHTIMEIVYNNIDYKIEHVYQKARTNIQVMSYLYKKIDGKYVLLTDTGLVSKFKEMVAKELDYEDHLYPILNIGIDNKGLVGYTNTEKLEYLKKILKMDILTEIKNNVNNKFTYNNSTLKFISEKLKNNFNIETLELSKKSIEANLVTASNMLTTDLVKLEQLSHIDDQVINETTHSIDTLAKAVVALSSIKDLLDKYEDRVSLQHLYDYATKTNIVCTTKTEDINDRIMKINEDLMNTDNHDIEEYKKNISDIESKIRSITSKYKKKQEFKDISLEVLYNIKSYIESIISILQEFAGDANTLRHIMQHYTNKTYLEEIQGEIDENKIAINSVTNDIENISVSSKLVELCIPDDCDKYKTCQLAGEYNRQLEKLNLYKRLNDDLEKLEKIATQLSEEYDQRVRLSNVIASIRGIKVPTELKDFINYELINIIDNNNIQQLYNDILQHIAYKKDMNELNDLETKLDSLVVIVNTYTADAISKKDVLLAEIVELQDKKKILDDTKIENAKILNDISSTLLDSEYNKTKYSDIDSTNNKLKESIDKKTKELNKMIEANDTIIKLREVIDAKKKEIKELQEEYSDIKNKIKTINDLVVEYEDIKQKTDTIKMIREVVSNDLPAKMLESYLYDISRIVNTLLNDFMSIRFDITDGIEIVCNRNGEERLSQFLSQGESSMLSIALLIAFKKSIKWDVISIDEGSSVLDESNKDKYVHMIRDYSHTIPSIKQIFLVSHDYITDDNSYDIKIINIGG